RPKGGAGAGQVLLGDAGLDRHTRWLRRAGGGLGDLGQAKIKNFGVAALSDKNVCRLNVAMDDALGVGGVERIGDLDAQQKQRVEFHGTVADEMLQRCAVEVLHDDVGLAVLLAYVVDGADIGMIEGGCGSSLAAEALERLAVSGYIFGEEFEGDEAVEAGVLGFVHDAHTAAA